MATPQLDPAALETVLVRKIPPGGPVTIARGETVLVGVTGPLRDPPDTNEIDGKPFMSTRPAGITLLPWVEELGIRPGKRAAMVDTWVIFRADPRAPLGDARVSVRVDVVENNGARNLAILPLDISIKVTEAQVSTSAIERDRAAYALFDGRAEASARLISTFSVERLEMPPRASALIGDEKRALRAFLAARLRADAAHDHLRAAADIADDAISAAAIAALASEAPPYPKPDQRPAPLTQPARAVDQGIGLFDRHELELAYLLLYRARMTPELPVARLPDALVRLGAIEAARGNAALASDLTGQALCIRPDVGPPSTRAPLKATFDEVKRRGRCAHAMAPHSVTAAVVTTPAGPTVLVRAMFGPDPYHAIERGLVEVIDAGGAVRSKREVRATRGDLAALEASFEAADVGDAIDGVRVRAHAYDAGGIVVSVTGVPDPRVVPLAAEPEKELEITWWMWAAGGAAVLIGGAAVIALASGGEPTRAIGPVAVRF